MNNQYCEECGISASITYNQDLKDHRVKLDEKLDTSIESSVLAQGSWSSLVPFQNVKKGLFLPIFAIF